MSGEGAPAGERHVAAGRPRLARMMARLQRFRKRIRSRPLLNTIWRVAIFVAGWLVVLAGVVMLAIPGPGWGSIFVGFAILATEFVWARRTLRKAQRVAKQAANRALDPKVRRRNQVIAALAVVVVVLGCGAYVWFYGVPEIVPYVGGRTVR